MTPGELRSRPDLTNAALSHAWEFDMRLSRGETLDGLLGLRVTERRAGRIAGRLPVRDAICQPAGPVHGGVYAAVAEALALVGTLDAVADEGSTAVELSNSTSFLGPVSEGTLHAVARARHTAATSWVWDVELSDDEGRLCAVSRVTFAVREGSRGEDGDRREGSRA